MSIKFIDIIKNIKNIKGLETDVSVAKMLGMSKANLHNHKKTNTIPFKKIMAFCEREHIDSSKILRRHSGISRDVSINTVAEPEPPYQTAGLRRVTDNIPLKISDLIHKTSYILESDTPHKIAFVGIIEACYRAVKSEERINEQERKIKELEDKIKLLAEAAPPAVGE